MEGRRGVRGFSVASLITVVLILATAAPSSNAAPARPRSFTEVTAVSRISRDLLHGARLSEDDTQVEPSLAVDPLDDRHEVAVFQNGRYPDGAAAGAGFATTIDRGTTWTSGVLPGLTWVTGGEFERTGDHVITFGPDGAVYAVMTGFNGVLTATRHSAIVVARSDDGGLAWSNPMVVQEDHDRHLFHDNPSIGIDSNPASPHFGRIYVTWIRERFVPGVASPIVLSASDDRGTTWSPMVDVSRRHTNNEGAHPLVLPDGSLTIVWARLKGPHTQIESRTSTDGGATFGPFAHVSDDLWTESPHMRSGFGLPSSAVDPATGELYVAWQDARFRTDGLNDAVISRSMDGGATWTSPARVNLDPPDGSLDHLTPVVAANGGVVAVCYRTRVVSGRNGSKYADERCIHSEDGGVTFRDEVSLGPPSDDRFAAKVVPFTMHGTAFLGDYMGVTVSPGAIHAAWARASFEGDAQGPHHQTIWAGTILR
jgi:hypothetical protein